MPAVKEALAAQQAAPAEATMPRKSVRQPVDIMDIRADRAELNLRDEVVTKINPEDGSPRMLPTLLLYDEKGLQLFEDITYLDEYYLTNYEIELLKTHASEMASMIPAGSLVVELGSGNLRKVCLLLQAFEDLGKPIEYYALDLSQRELERTLSQVPTFQHVHCRGLLGTYDDGCDWLKQFSGTSQPVCIIHLGSSIGNLHRDEASEFLESFANVLKPTDSIIIGLDSCSDPDKVYHAYNDSKGVTHEFILNGLLHANEAFDKQVFNLPEWKVIGEYIYDEDGGRHQAFLSPVTETNVLGSVIKPFERIKIEQSLKYSQIGAEKLWKSSGLQETKRWRRGDDYGLHMLQKAKLPFSTVRSLYAAHVLPTLQDWASLWEAWDIVTQGMLPDEELQEKPIKLRNACIFYLGHIPTFLDIQLSKMTKDLPTEPATYHSIFERGIDPDVDNPDHCHDHSEVPDEWPPVKEIIAYQDRVRARLRALYANGQGNIPRDIGRAIWIGFEHELMHIETLLYMMVQSDKTLPPPHTISPDFAAMAEKARKARVPNQWFDVPAQTVTLGMDDPENGTNPNVNFGWDNEKPQRKTSVRAFQAQGRPITNEEYAKYLYSSKIDQLPASWATSPEELTNGSVSGVSSSDLPESFLKDKTVRTLYGLVPLKFALDWPVFASYDELAGCAAWMGGRIPTMEEAKSIYAYVEKQKEASMQSKLSNMVPAVNAHLVNDGVEETPPALNGGASQQVNGEISGASPQELFIDLSGANVGLRRWHPQPVTANGGTLAGQGGMGGVWEWTSTPLAKHAGFEPMALYPGYTADFFDSKHNIVLGGSWATHPRIAGRKSFVNWYQRNYPFAWAGVRLVRDA